MVMDMNHYGQEMYQLAKRLFPICRSITGNGVRETLDILSEIAMGESTYNRCFPLFNK